MKKFLQIITFTFVIAASLFFVAGQSLDYFVFKYRQTVIRKEIKKQIKNGVEESELFVFSYEKIQTGNVEWVKEGKEFRINGSMYDIVHLKIENGEWIYKCVNDTQEAKLFVELDNLVKKRMNGNSSDDYLKNLVKDFVKVYFDSESTCFLDSPQEESTLFRFSFYHLSFEITSPPPQNLI